ncbi:MAG: sigma-70 domain-containing protein [Gemmataceae bacterium]
MRRCRSCGTCRALQDGELEPTIEKSAIAAGISYEECKRVLKISQQPISLDRPVGRARIRTSATSSRTTRSNRR